MAQSVIRACNASCCLEPLTTMGAPRASASAFASLMAAGKTISCLLRRLMISPSE
jgi:hypothetical protein